MSVTVRDIAGLAGVSITTVSRVLNGAANVSEETRGRVEEILWREGYRRKRNDPSAPPKKRVCIVMPASTDSRPYMHPTIYTILGGLTGKLAEFGIANTHYMLAGTPESVAGLIGSTADGFLFIRTSADQEDRLLPRLLERGRPVIVVNRRLDDKRLSYVNIDDFTAAYQAVKYLVKNGHKKISLVNGDLSMRNSQLRMDGYLHAMRECGLTIADGWILSGEYSEEYGRTAAAELLSLPSDLRPTAVFTTSDTIACGIQKTFLRAGLRLPQQMSLIGFGDTELCPMMTPPLTSVRIPAREIGVQAAIAMNQMLTSPAIGNMKILMKTELCVRGSVCTPEE